MKIQIPPLDLHAGQRSILTGTTRFRTIAAGRRFGKTLLAIEWLSLMNGGAVDGRPVAFFSPSYKLLLDVWSDMERTLKPIIRKANKTEMRIELITGGVIDFWTMEDANAGRGRKYARIVLDEAAHARYLKEAWERAIAPTLTDFKGEAWFISTPAGINYFHELYQRGNDPAHPDWQSWHMPTTANPHISEDEVPAKLTSGSGQKLVSLIGDRAAESLIDYAAGDVLYIAAGWERTQGARYREIKAMRARGMSYDEIAIKYQYVGRYSSRNVRIICDGTSGGRHELFRLGACLAHVLAE